MKTASDDSGCSIRDGHSVVGDFLRNTLLPTRKQSAATIVQSFNGADVTARDSA
jgi:hypothetical protein